MLLRRFLLAALLLAAGVISAAEAAPWYRGQLHSHTYLSDGRGFPEQLAAAYKSRGYNFLAITDHNRFADDAKLWRKVMAEEGKWPHDVTKAMYDAYVEACSSDWVETKTEDGVTQVRLKTFAEVKSWFDAPGEFILLPGVELSEELNGVAIHLNGVNLPAVPPSFKDGGLIRKVKGQTTAAELLAANAAEVDKLSADLKQPAMLTLNHPFWTWCNVVPQNLVDTPAIRFFEVCNCGSAFAPNPQAAAYGPEQFWDAVNAFRCAAGQPLLYGLATDDTHYYDAKRIDDGGGVGDAWVMVRAPALTPEALLAAMGRGDFYATCGVLLDDVAFTPADKTLRVKVKAEGNAKYRILFIATKRGFDRTVTALDSPAEGKRSARKLPIYSADIGKTVKTVEGVAGEYTLADDDLYVRARIESDLPAKIKRYFHPTVKTAWTQPYLSGK